MLPSKLASILIVEDEVPWQEIYQDMLQDKYALTFAGTLQQAEAALSSNRFDLAIIDPGLDLRDRSNLDGIKVIKRIATLDSPVPVVVVTGDKTRVQADDPQLNGFIAAVIEKSAPVAKVTQAVETILKSPIAKSAETVEAVLNISRAQNRWRYLSRPAPGVTGYEAFKQVVNQLLRLTNADVAHLLVPTDSELEIIVATGQDEGRTFRINDSVTGRAYRTRESINLGDARSDPEYKPPVKAPQMNSELVFPVQRGNEIVGVLNIESQRYHAFGEWHKELMSAFADLAVLMAQNERRQREVEALQFIARELLRSALNLDMVWQSILGRGLEMINADIGFLATKEDYKRLRIKAATKEHVQGQLLDIDTSVAGLAVRSELPQRIDDVFNDERTSLFRDSLDPIVLSVLAVPIQLDNQTIGVLNFESKSPHAFTAEDEKLILFLNDYASLAMRMERQAREQADYEGIRKQNTLAAKFLHNGGTPICNIRDWLDEIRPDEFSELKEQFPNIALVISYIRKSTIPLITLVNQLYDQVVQEVSLISIDVNATIQSAIADALSMEREYAVNIVTQLAPDLPRTLANDSLKDVFVELLQNAIEAMRSAGEIQIGTELLPNNTIRVWVSDTGEGMTPIVRQHAFNSGFTTKNRSAGMHGLGLSWCKQFIETTCKGSIYVEHTEPGKGTTMALILPACANNIKNSAFPQH